MSNRKFIDQLSAALGDKVIALLADSNTLTIERPPESEMVRVFGKDEQWHETSLRISGEAVNLFIKGVGEYRGIPISDANPLATAVRLPKELFQDAEVDVAVPPVSPNGPTFIIHTERSVKELNARKRETTRKLNLHPLLVKQQTNGRVGEVRTEAILARQFWIFTRSVDVDGADLIIEMPANTREALRKRRTEPAFRGVVQAKYFEGTNAVKVKKEYVLENDGSARKDFFLFVHTDEEQGDDQIPVDYFFEAADIVEHLPLSKNAKGPFYEFRLSQNRRYEPFKNIRRKVIVNRIARTLRIAQKLYLSELTESLYIHSRWAGLFGEDSPVTYLFRKVEGADVVLVRNDQSGETVLLEPRRDLYEYTGSFAWGNAGLGPRFLTTSLLAHYLDGQDLSNMQWNRMLDYLDMCPSHREFDLSSSLVKTIISG